VSGFDGLMDFINDVARNVVETEHLTLRNENIRRGFFSKVKVFRFTPSCIKKSFQFNDLAFPQNRKATRRIQSETNTHKIVYF
jgi:hypothetical protein